MDRIVCVVLLGILLLAGCDTTIDPVRKDTYSIYGYLSPGADTQFIRVKPLRTPLQAEANRVIDATVTLQDVEGGTTHALQDSVVVFVDEGDRSITHNFWTDADIQPNTTYRLEVKEDGNVITSAETTTPTDAVPTVVPTEGNCLTEFRVRFDESERIPILLRGEFAYDGGYHRVPFGTEVANPSGGFPFLTFVPETDLLDERIPANDRITIPFGADLLPPRCLELDSDTLRVQYVYASSNWHEIDVQPVEPGNFVEYVQNTQVQGGQGFFGALTRGRISVAVDTSDTLQVGASSTTSEPRRSTKSSQTGHGTGESMGLSNTTSEEKRRSSLGEIRSGACHFHRCLRSP